MRKHFSEETIIRGNSYLNKQLSEENYPRIHLSEETIVSGSSYLRRHVSE